jgi:arginine decarboxylase
MPKRPPARYSEIGCRIPEEYFWVIGRGESDVGIKTGSYDAALHMAGIENYNVVLYTSVLPPETVELAHLPDIHHGSALEGIIAVQHTDKPGTRITAGLLMAKVYSNSNDRYLGGFACEYVGNGSVEEAESNLREAMQQLFEQRYKTRLYKLEFGKSVVRTYLPENRSGRCLSASAWLVTLCRY